MIANPSPAAWARGAAAPADARPRWAVRLLGAVEAQSADGATPITHWPSRAVAALLARLALAPGRAHAREELVELLWPGVELDVGRNRLRQALSTLKSILESPIADGAPVLQADRMSIRVLPGALDSDVQRFECCVRAGDGPGARAQYGGDLMPGHYEDWVLDERRRLSDLFEQLGAPPSPASAPVPPVPAAAPPLPSGLPSFWTRSIGAELTASRLRVLVCAQRLVTVHGPGGSGKTRLAVDVARALRDGPPLDLPDVTAAPPFSRVVFVPLVDCVDGAQTLDAVTSALHAEGEGDPRHRIQAALAGGPALLLLDNVEQLDAQAGVEIARLLSQVPQLHVVVTSRRLLDLDGEVAFELDGLPLPPPDAALEDAATNPSVMLFVDRARAARADFHLSARNVRAVAGLVRLLGGMPLAIELAASRVRSLTPQELLQRLSEGAGTPMLDLLARSAQRTTPGTRHASMRHVVDWSWRQLTPAQAALLQAMTVFSATAQPAAVAAVAGVALRQAQTLLDELHDASLVRQVPAADERTRYALLQPVREFAAETWSDDAARLARLRLRQWLLSFADEVMPHGVAAVGAETAHVHAAIVSATADGPAAQALAMQLAVALRPYWEADDLPLSSVQALELGLPHIDDAALRTDAHELLAYGFGSAGLAALARTHAEAAVAGAQDDRRHALVLARWVWATYYAGHFDEDAIMRALDRAALFAQRSGDIHAQATVLRVQAPMVSNLRLDYAGAERLATQAQALWERLGNNNMARVALANRATMWAWQNRNEEALTVLAHCEQSSRADGDWVGVLTAARQQGRVLVRLRRWEEALVAVRRAVDVGWRRRYARGLANALLNLPQPLLMAGQPEAAARLHGFALAHWTRLYGAINRIETRELRGTRRLLRLRLGGSVADALRLEGAALDLAAAVALALDRPAA